MENSNILSTLKPKTFNDIVITLLWVSVLVIAARFVIVNALPYYGLTEETMGRWWNYKWSLIGHISGGIIALIIGPLQFWKAFRNRYLAFHR